MFETPIDLATPSALASKGFVIGHNPHTEPKTEPEPDPVMSNGGSGKRKSKRRRPTKRRRTTKRRPTKIQYVGGKNKKRTPIKRRRTTKKRRPTKRRR